MFIEDGALYNVRRDEAKGHFVIPDGVTRIGEWAFQNCTSLTSIAIPDSVTSIGDSAFWNCSRLKNITIPDGVTSIGDYAFCGCFMLTSVTIPDSVTTIGESVFYDCYSLVSKAANYKAFKLTSSGQLKCLRKIYNEGRKSFVKGELKLCANGIHYCTNLFEIFNHYYGEIDKDIAIYECDVSEENIGKENYRRETAYDNYTSKRCARYIVPKKRLHREDVIRILNGGE